MFTIRNIQVVITWRSNTVSNHYHADVGGIYGDIAVRLHTEILMKQFNMSADSLEGPILDFIVTKPLVRTIPLLPKSITHQ